MRSTVMVILAAARLGVPALQRAAPPTVARQRRRPRLLTVRHLNRLFLDREECGGGSVLRTMSLTHFPEAWRACAADTMRDTQKEGEHTRTGGRRSEGRRVLRAWQSAARSCAVCDRRWMVDVRLRERRRDVRVCETHDSRGEKRDLQNNTPDHTKAPR